MEKNALNEGLAEEYTLLFGWYRQLTGANETSLKMNFKPNKHELKIS